MVNDRFLEQQTGGRGEGGGERKSAKGEREGGAAGGGSLIG